MHRTLTGFMALWLSGVVFLLCCDTANGNAMSPEFCPLAKTSSHCDKGTIADSTSPSVADLEQNSLECCTILATVFDKTRKIERAQSQAVTDPKLFALRFISPAVAGHNQPHSLPASRVSDKHHLFIQNCVFRI